MPKRVDIKDSKRKGTLETCVNICCRSSILVQRSCWSPIRSIASAVLYPTTLQASKPGPPFLLLVLPVLYLSADIGPLVGSGVVFLFTTALAVLFEELRSGEAPDEKQRLGKERCWLGRGRGRRIRGGIRGWTQILVTDPGRAL